MTTRRITVPVMTRVEGEGALFVRIQGRQVKDLQLRIYEPPRYFEKFLEGRTWKEVPDIVARICGICPAAYQMSAVHALEHAFGITIPPEIRALRRLYYCGEWLESHSLHIHMLAAPDFLGFPDAIALARQHPDIVRRGMQLQGLGNAILNLFGGRSVNPVGVRVGGFYRAPTREEMTTLAMRLRTAQPAAEALVQWASSLDLPELERDAPQVSLRHDHEYPMNEGRVVSSRGLDIAATAFDDRFQEHQVPYSTALHARLDGQPYWVGPLPRLNNNLDRLPPETSRLLPTTGIRWPSANPYHSVVARALEVHLALNEAIRLLEEYRPLARGFVEATPRAGIGIACTEAPRGLLWHRYELDGDGFVRGARIVPPTSQNQAQIEADLRQSVLESLGMDDEALRLRLEVGIRNYDPCISCAAHFLRLTVAREP